MKMDSNMYKSQNTYKIEKIKRADVCCNLSVDATVIKILSVELVSF